MRPKLCILLVSMFLLSCVRGEALESADQWTFAGWYGGGMYPGIVPDPAVKGRIYLLSDVAGLWRSDNRGDDWHFINDGLGNLNIACLAIAQSDSNVLYAGTKAGIMRSDNAGKSWISLDSTVKKIIFMKPRSYRAIVVDTYDPAVVYAGSADGKVFSSHDKGLIWEEIGSLGKHFGSAEPVSAVQLSKDLKFLFVGARHGLLRYEIEKKEWKKLPLSTAEDLLVTKEGVLYVVNKTNVAYSSDNGETWSYSSSVKKGELIRIDAMSSKDDPAILLAGGHQGWNGSVLVSKDNGKNWTDIGKEIHCDVAANPTRVWMKKLQKPNAVAIDPFDSSKLYLTDSWGVWRSDDAGRSWYEKIKGAPNSSGSDIQVDVNGNVYVSTMDDGLLTSSDGGISYKAFWPNERSPAGIAGHIWRVLIHENSILATSTPWNRDYNQVLRGSTEQSEVEIVRSGLPKNFPVRGTLWGKGYPRAIAADPDDSNHIYMGIDGERIGGFFQSFDGGSTWVRSEGQPGSMQIYNALAVDSSTPEIIYWGTSGSQGGIFRSINKGQTWQRVLEGHVAIFDIAITSQGTVYAAGNSDGPVLYASYDQGESWLILKKFEGHKKGACEAITLDPKNPQTILVGVVEWNERSGGGIYITKDGGKNWEDMTLGLPNNSGPAAMAINSKDGMLYALLYAGSVYKRSLSNYRAGAK